jgi:NADH:ubiquinone oxidoreductase subunit 3 (subunit A)
MIMISDAKNEKLLANEYKYLLQTERTDWSIYFKNIWENSYYKPWKFITELHDIQVINDYKIFIIFVFSAIILSIIVTNVSRFIINSIINFDRSKVSVYECGFQPFEQLDKSQLFIFYRLSIIFIIFEAELIFIYPWILRIANQTTFFNAINYYYNPMLFIIIIIYGFYYEIKHRALDI